MKFSCLFLARRGFLGAALGDFSVSPLSRESLEKMKLRRVRPAGAPLTGTGLRRQKVAVKQAEPIF